MKKLDMAFKPSKKRAKMADVKDMRNENMIRAGRTFVESMTRGDGSRALVDPFSLAEDI